MISYNRKLTDFADEIGLTKDRRVAADKVQTVETWLTVLRSLAEETFDSGLLRRTEAASRAEQCLNTVLNHTQAGAKNRA